MGMLPRRIKFREHNNHIEIAEQDIETFDNEENEIINSEAKTKYNFSFSMVDNLVYKSNEYVEADSERELYYDKTLNEYEKAKYVQYYYNYYTDLFKNTRDKIDFVNFAIKFFYLIKDKNFSKIKQLSLYKVEKIEKEINNLPEIQDLLAKWKNSIKYPKLDVKILITLPNFIKILNESTKNILNCLSVWLKEVFSLNLKKAYYTKNLYKFFDLISLTDKNLKAYIEFLMYSRISTFNKKLLFNLKSDESCLKVLNIKRLNKAILDKYKDILFTHSSLSIFNVNDKKKLIDTLVFGLFTEFNSDQEFENFFLPKLKTVELTSNDFKYIQQYDYLKSILSNALQKGIKGINILFYGSPGTGKSALARVLINEVTKNGYEVPCGINNFNFIHDDMRISDTKTNINSSTRIEQFFLLNNIIKNTKNSIILYDEAEDFFTQDKVCNQSKLAINEILEENTNPVIWTTNSLYCMQKSFLRRFTYAINIDALPNDVYNGILNKLLNKYDVVVNDNIKNIILNYKPSVGILEKVLKTYSETNVKNLNCLKENLLDNLKAENYGENLNTIVTNKSKFNIQLTNTSENLEEIVNALKENKRLDFSMLLYGVPGSSKTSFGRYLAEQLNLKVINKNYTDLSSMWVGETEKNIKKLFEEAKRDKALIILDECDVLLQDRTKAYRSWEISQTEALLTCMEEHPYPFIMTTNLYDNLDQAVMRRILYKIKHDYLTYNQIKIAFDFFFNIKLNDDEATINNVTSGDFAIIKKKAEYLNKLTDKDWLLEALCTEIKNKKDFSLQRKINL